MSKSRLVVVAIVLILCSLSFKFMSNTDSRAGSTLIISDLIENQEYIVFSPIVTSFTPMEQEQGIQRMLIAENSKELSEIRSFTLDSKNVDKEDYDKLTYGSKLIRKGNTVKIIAPITELPQVIKVGEDKET